MEKSIRKHNKIRAEILEQKIQTKTREKAKERQEKALKMKLDRERLA